jgi:hypothetical protein
MIQVLDGDIEFSDMSSSDASSSLLDIKAASITPDAGFPIEASTASYLTGRLRPSGEPASRHDVKLGLVKGVGRGAGKIDHEGAKKQANFAFVGNEDDKEGERPMIAAGTKGVIRVETMSWMGAIKRKFGLDLPQNQKQ